MKKLKVLVTPRKPGEQPGSSRGEAGGGVSVAAMAMTARQAEMARASKAQPALGAQRRNVNMRVEIPEDPVPALHCTPTSRLRWIGLSTL